MPAALLFLPREFTLSLVRQFWSSFFVTHPFQSNSPLSPQTPPAAAPLARLLHSPTSSRRYPPISSTCAAIQVISGRLVSTFDVQFRYPPPGPQRALGTWSSPPASSRFVLPFRRQPPHHLRPPQRPLLLRGFNVQLLRQTPPASLLAPPPAAPRSSALPRHWLLVPPPSAASPSRTEESSFSSHSVERLPAPLLVLYDTSSTAAVFACSISLLLPDQRAAATL